MKFNNELFFEAMNEIAERNLLDRDELNKIIENAFFKTFHSKIDPDARLELFVDFKNKKFQLINHSKLVVSDDEYEEKYRSLEISISEAKKTKKDIKVGDEFSEEVDLFQNTKFSSQVKQLITQIVREKRKEAVYNKHKSIKGEMVEATLLSLENNGNAIFKLNDDTIAFMPAKFRNMNIKLNIGGKTKLYVEDVLEESKDSQIIVSNGSPTIIKRIIEKNVPEVEEGIVEIVKISRIAGTRSKVSVKSNNENVDPVGAIIGSGGNRIKSILEKLSGEKIDIIN
jgi:N utilization substance protein A